MAATISDKGHKGVAILVILVLDGVRVRVMISGATKAMEEGMAHKNQEPGASNANHAVLVSDGNFSV